MHICFCADGYPSKELPYSAFIGVLCEELTRQGCDITVIAPQSLTKHLLRGTPLAPKRFTVSVETEDGHKSITVYRPYSLTFGEGLLGKITLRMNRWTTKRCVNKINISFDVVYAHFWKSAYNIVNFVKKKSLPFFVASGEDVIDIHEILSSEEINIINKNVRGCICVSSKNMEESVSIGLTDDDKTVVISNSISQKDFFLKNKFECRRNLGYSEDDFIIAFCGRFIHRKGVMRVSDAIKLIDDRKIKSIFIGSNYENEKEQPDCDGILFMGTLPHNTMVDYLNCADVFVLPTLAEGCSNSIVEAMACGLPIISSDMPFNYDILDSSNSILVDPLDVKEIANAIITLKKDEALRSKLSKGAIKKASELTIEKRASKILNFIREKCGKVE